MAIAMVECYTCTDETLIRSSWPVIEASYQRHEAVIAKFSGGTLRGPLARLMHRTRQRVAPILAAGTSDGNGRGRSNFTSTTAAGNIASIPDEYGVISSSLETHDITRMLGNQALNQSTSASELGAQQHNFTSQQLFSTIEPQAFDVPMAEDPSFSWDELMSGMNFFDDMGGAARFFYEPGSSGEPA